eukprot:2064596-Rhodomonas_salina.1
MSGAFFTVMGGWSGLVMGDWSGMKASPKKKSKKDESESEDEDEDEDEDEEEEEAPPPKKQRGAPKAKKEEKEKEKDDDDDDDDDADEPLVKPKVCLHPGSRTRAPSQWHASVVLRVYHWAKVDDTKGKLKDHVKEVCSKADLSTLTLRMVCPVFPSRPRPHCLPKQPC